MMMRKQQGSPVVSMKRETNARPGVKRHSGARRRLALWLSVCTIFLAWAGVQLFHQTGKIVAKQTELEQTEHKLMETEQLHDDLQKRIERLHDPAYVAELARKEYYMTKEGEIIFINTR